jgi:hypothetical protein
MIILWLPHTVSGPHHETVEEPGDEAGFENQPHHLLRKMRSKRNCISWPLEVNMSFSFGVRLNRQSSYARTLVVLAAL